LGTSRIHTLTVARFRASQGASKMFDLAMLALGIAFFVVSIGYVYACDRL
jgi:hypothetical protein